MLVRAQSDPLVLREAVSLRSTYEEMTAAEVSRAAKRLKESNASSVIVLPQTKTPQIDRTQAGNE